MDASFLLWIARRAKAHRVPPFARRGPGPGGRPIVRIPDRVRIPAGQPPRTVSASAPGCGMVPSMPRLRLLLLALLAGCSPGATALHVLPGSGGPAQDFYALPFPSDLRLGPGGAFDLSGYPSAPGQIGIYIDQMNGRIP